MKSVSKTQHPKHVISRGYGKNESLIYKNPAVRQSVPPEIAVECELLHCDLSIQCIKCHQEGAKRWADTPHQHSAA